MAAKKKPAAGASKRPSKPLKSFDDKEAMRGRSARAMTQQELQAALVKKYGVPMVPPMTRKQAVQRFQDVVSESNLWNYPGVMKAAAAVATRGWAASAEDYYTRGMKKPVSKKSAPKRK
jgi:hypothetical protein